MTLFNLALTKETDRVAFTVNDVFGEGKERGNFYVSFVRDEYVIVDYDVNRVTGKGKEVMSITFDTYHNSNKMKFEYPLFNGCITLFILVYADGGKYITVDLKQ